MNFTDLFKIDPRFEKAVNISLDLGNLKKIKSYIPTASASVILKQYLDETITFTGSRATILIGPYGKGKSHLLLVLLAILSNADDETISEVLSRIEISYPEITDTVQRIKDSHRKYLPVIVSPGSNSLDRAFLHGLTQALRREGLESITPDSYFGEAVKTIETWRKSYPETYNKLVNNTDKVNIDELVSRLKSFDADAIEYFTNVFPQLTSGSKFNPIVDDQVISVYRSVNRTLKEKYGYAGIYIVFDEFSKYIEGHDEATFSEDMKTLQDVCELCNSSADEGLFLTCVAHRSIKSYGATLPKTVLNAFKGIEGRIKEVFFVASSKNNYELIADVIAKKPVFDAWAENDDSYKAMAAASFALRNFSSTFTEGDFNRIVARGCYPLTPAAAMLLLELSEKIAQNERTLFTFIAAQDRNTLVWQTKQHKEVHFIGCESIYDYFVPLFRDEIDPAVNHEWLKAEYAVSKVQSPSEARVIKTLAVIRMINKPNELPANRSLMLLASGLEEVEYDTALQAVVDAGLVEIRNRTATYDFKNNIGIDFETAIADCIQKYYLKADPCTVLNELMDPDCILPKKHNLTHGMTRYFNFRVMSAEQYLKMLSTKYLTWDNRPDGCVVLLLPGVWNVNEIIEHTERLDDPCLIVCCPAAGTVDCSDRTRFYLAVKRLLTDPAFLDNNVVLKKELEEIRDSVEDELNEWLLASYLAAPVAYTQNGLLNIDSHGLNRAVSDICDAVYTHTPIINNELINRHSISPIMARVRSTVLTDMFNETGFDAYETGTSAESTVYRAVLQHIRDDAEMRVICGVVEDFAGRCVGQAHKFSEVISELEAPPYGLRKGVEPFILADCLLQLDNLPVICLKDKETALTPDAICNIVEKPDEYSLFIEQETVEKNRYIHELERVFTDYCSYCGQIDKRNRLSRVVCLIQSWYRSLPQTSVIFTEPDYEGQDMTTLTKFRKIFAEYSINPRETLFVKLPKLFKTNDYAAVVTRIECIKDDIDAHVHILKQETARIVRTAFSLRDNADLGNSLQEWLRNLPFNSSAYVFNTTAKSVLDYIPTINTSDCEEIAGRIAKIVTGSFIEDWKSCSDSRFAEGLANVVTEVAAKQEQADRETVRMVDKDGTSQEVIVDFDMNNMSSTGVFFKNALEGVLEEYGDNLENNEKIGILMDLIRQIKK